MVLPNIMYFLATSLHSSLRFHAIFNYVFRSLFIYLLNFSLSLSCLFTPLFRAFSLPLSHTTLINLMTLHFRHCNAFSPPSRSSIPPMVRPIPHSLNHIIHSITSFTAFIPSPLLAHTTAPLSSRSPSTPISNYQHPPHWDPNTRDK